MTLQELERTLLRLASRIAPEVDPATIDVNEPIQRALDIDSYDFLNLLVTIRDELGVSIDEGDYDKVGTLADMARFLLPRITARDAGGSKE